MRKAFTLIELIVVILILGVLAGLITYGLARISTNQREKSTRTTLANLESMLQELKSANQMKNLPVGEVLAPQGDMGADVASPSHDIRFSAMRDTQEVMRRMLSVPANKSLLAKLPSDNLLTEKPSGINVSYLDQKKTGKIDPPLPLDGWGNPILYVGGPDSSIGSGAPSWEDRYGLQDVRLKQYEGTPLYAKPPPITNPAQPYLQQNAPNAIEILRTFRPFWASAGADGDFSKGDDNVYSFEN
jgi:prepilin-type N-terminal cleavage/methylation domain-containing protein